MPAIRFHELRHYYASLLNRHGESVKTLQARLGHASSSEILDTYSHLWPDNDERTRAAADGVLRNLAVYTGSTEVPKHKTAGQGPEVDESAGTPWMPPTDLCCADGPAAPW